MHDMRQYGLTVQHGVMSLFEPILVVCWNICVWECGHMAEICKEGIFMCQHVSVAALPHDQDRWSPNSSRQPLQSSSYAYTPGHATPGHARQVGHTLPLLSLHAVISGKHARSLDAAQICMHLMCNAAQFKLALQQEMFVDWAYCQEMNFAGLLSSWRDGLCSSHPLPPDSLRPDSSARSPDIPVGPHSDTICSYAGQHTLHMWSLGCSVICIAAHHNWRGPAIRPSSQSWMVGLFVLICYILSKSVAGYGLQQIQCKMVSYTNHWCLFELYDAGACLSYRPDTHEQEWKLHSKLECKLLCCQSDEYATLLQNAHFGMYMDAPGSPRSPQRLNTNAPSPQNAFHHQAGFGDPQSGRSPSQNNIPRQPATPGGPMGRADHPFAAALPHMYNPHLPLYVDQFVSAEELGAPYSPPYAGPPALTTPLAGMPSSHASPYSSQSLLAGFWKRHWVKIQNLDLESQTLNGLYQPMSLTMSVIWLSTLQVALADLWSSSESIVLRTLESIRL